MWYFKESSKSLQGGEIDIQRQYIVQSIVNAANNLRLSSEKIEVVAHLKYYFTKCESIEEEIKKLKSKTQFSKFAVKLSELYNYSSKNNLDLLTLSDNLKEHIHYIVKELSNLLDVLTPQSVKEILDELDGEKSLPNEEEKVKSLPTDIDMGILSKIGIEENKVKPNIDFELPEKSESDQLKEDFILDDLSKIKSFTFENYEETILKYVKELDQFLKKVNLYKYGRHEYDNYINKMRTNADLSSTMGFEIIAKMHVVFARGLELLRDGVVKPTEQMVEGLRSCLIVIVAVVRGKDVDITAYLSRAEAFGKQIINSKFDRDIK